MKCVLDKITRNSNFQFCFDTVRGPEVLPQSRLFWSVLPQSRLFWSVRDTLLFLSSRVAEKITKELRLTSLRLSKALREKLLKWIFLLHRKSLSPRALAQEEMKVAPGNIHYNCPFCFLTTNFSWHLLNQPTIILLIMRSTFLVSIYAILRYV